MMPCCCCSDDEEDSYFGGDAKSGASDPGTESTEKWRGGPHPAPQTMRRGEDEVGGGDHTGRDSSVGGDSDYRAVEWIRTRSAESSQYSRHIVELSPDASRVWQLQRGSPHRNKPHRSKKKMATLESIEIEDLSHQVIPLSDNTKHNETASTVSSRAELDRPEPDDASTSQPSPARIPNKITTVSGVDELDAIVMALQQKESSRTDSFSSIPSGRNSLSQIGTPKNVSPRSKESFTATPRASPGQPTSPPAITLNKDGLRKSPKYTMEATRPASNQSQTPRKGQSTSPLDSRFGDRPQDSLSDVPSDVDPTTRDRYLKACRLLKATLIEREPALLPTEEQFLRGLLEANVLSDEQVSAIETASQTLLSDPLFQVGSVHSSSFEEAEDCKPVPARPSWQERALMKDRDPLSRSSGNMRAMPSLVDEEVLTETGASVANTVARFDGKDFPFYILGVTPDFKIGVLTPTLMESLRSFFPFVVANENFWLKFSLQRDGASLPKLLSKVRTSKHTVLGVETTDGHVFGAFCSSPWRVQNSWFGSTECFLWRLKRSRLSDGTSRRNFGYDNEMEVYPYTGSNDLIQYCTSKTIAVGGGDWSDGSSSPYKGEPTGIGFMIDGDLMGGETNACATFNNPRLGERLSTGHNEFDIRNLEVWTGTYYVWILLSGICEHIRLKPLLLCF